MVSLLNYKTVDTELHQVDVPNDGHSREMSICQQKQILDCPRKAGEKFFAHVMRYENRQKAAEENDNIDNKIQKEEQTTNRVIICDTQGSREDSLERTKSQKAPTALEVVANSNTSAISRLQDNQPVPIDVIRSDTKLDQRHNGSTKDDDRIENPTSDRCNSNDDMNSDGNLSGKNVCISSGSRKPDFVVTWRNLNFVIEPKWHQKLAFTTRSALSKQGTSKQSKGSAKLFGIDPTGTANGTELNVRSSTASEPRVVLDRLDGSFKSGELTAILGPSGAGKTTLLDCLTGHRKSGLSGSIRIATRTGSRMCDTTRADKVLADQHDNEPKVNRPIAHRSNHSQLENDSSFVIDGSSSLSPVKEDLTEKTNSNSSNSSNNLKVSIIPQNDHLIGHLTVYETLNYASKMKNCLYKDFDHESNVKYVAHQLGLMSCLSTRINKLSGGQYKRVSIAQELLSSPDILILDEPTSGLDAMTCYQTVQVLRRLTDERKLSGQKQIAVILTIHQPNSDVFQQFNHVYVVAQGGKCIYEGPPSNVETTINKVGISLPNSFYNPATMIVEIAGGKFSQDIIHKLNIIQKKQHEVSQASVDEENSTGDSAVDCKSSTSSSTADDLDDGDHDEKLNNYDVDPKSRTRDQSPSNAIVVDTNNNIIKNSSLRKKKEGYFNEGFVLSGSDISFSKRQEKVLAIVLDDGNNNKTATPIQVVVKASSQDMNDESRRKRRCKTNRNHGNCGSQNNDNTTRELRTLSEADLKDLAAVGGVQAALMVDGGGGGSGGGNGGGGGGGNGIGNDFDSRDEKRIKLNSLKADQKFPFWRHTYLHFHRSWLSIVRDPMLCSMQLALHIIVPVMVSLVYGTNVGKPNACPRAGPVDIMAYALEPTDTALQLQEDLRTTLENIGYIFFKLYGIIFAAMTVTVLTFPLDMHVLVKEFRNGWYGLSSYFLGRTLADIPFQLTLPLLAMSLSYYATGQPYSHFQWRFLSITAILILSSLIAQSQGLLFGAILMDKMKAAVFVAPAATTPIILFAGFLVRTQSIPSYLRPLSNLSYLRYAIEACLISRYGFNQCDCDPAVFNQTVPELPPIARSMLDYWLSSFKPPTDNASTSPLSEGSGILNTTLGSNSTVTTISSLDNDQQSQPDLFTKLVDSLARANSFGRNITSCEQVVPYPMMDYDLHDSQLYSCFAILFTMLIVTRALTFFFVCFKVKQKV